MRRIWYGIDEIESIAEIELRKEGLFPSLDRPAIDIECFLERRADLDQHARLPKGVLGETHFSKTGTACVLINRKLTVAADGESRGVTNALVRWRSTLAHEAAHVILHQPLFVGNSSQLQLFGFLDDRDEMTEPSPRTRLMANSSSNSLGVDPGSAEFQANRGMAALLMPRTLFVSRFRREMKRRGFGRVAITSESWQARAIQEILAISFVTSLQATEIRMSELGLMNPAGQLELNS